MTITITAQHTGHTAYAITCCPEATPHQPHYNTPTDANTALDHIPGGRDYGCQDMRPILPGCRMPETCPEYPLHITGIHAEQPPEIHLHNRNAALLFDVLGLPELVHPANGGDSGELTADDLLGRAILAHELAPTDAGKPVIEDRRHIEGGRLPGYLQHRLYQLEQLAHWCQQRNLRINWA